MINQVTYWFGVVEDINDPEMLDRVRVRVYGAHSENKSISDIDGTPTEHLMWMNTIMPVTSASFGGIGSRHGLVPGSTVFGIYIDPEFQQGMVLGSMATKNPGIKDPSKGFSDPTGRYGIDKLEGKSSIPLHGQGVATDSVINSGGDQIANNAQYTPDLQNPGEEQDQDVSIIEMLRFHEGFRQKAYIDNHGIQIGYGHLLIGHSHDFNKAYKELSKILGRPAQSITKDEAEVLLKEDIKKFEIELKRHSELYMIYNQMNSSRQKVFLCWCYQMGCGGVLKFTNTLKYMKTGKWKEAYQGILSQEWARQTPDRCKMVASCIYNGNLEPYEILFGKKKAGTKPQTPQSQGSNSSSGGISGIVNTALGIVNKTRQVANQLGINVPDVNLPQIPGVSGSGYSIPSGYNINKIIIHCTAVPNGQNMQMAEIEQQHRGSKFNRSTKWKEKFNSNINHCGYQFIINTDGQIMTGRAVGEPGAHTGYTGLNCNVGSIGISLQGGKEGEKNENAGRYTKAQWLTLDKLIRDILKVYPNCSVKGHRDWQREALAAGTNSKDMALKACPSFDVQSWWRSGGGINQKNLLV